MAPLLRTVGRRDGKGLTGAAARRSQPSARGFVPVQLSTYPAIDAGDSTSYGGGFVLLGERE